MPFLSFQIDCTKHRSVDESEGRLWAESRGFLYFETSAQTGEGINEMFQVTWDEGDEGTDPVWTQGGLKSSEIPESHNTY